MLLSNRPDVSQLSSAEAAILGQGHLGIEPELGAHVLAIDMHMTGFATIKSIKVESVRTNPECGRHGLLIADIELRLYKVYQEGTPNGRRCS